MSKYKQIRQNAYDSNILINKLGLILFTFGNVSAADRDSGVFAIKPSGVPYEDLTPEMMVVVDFDGNVVEGKLNPSSDTLTHAVLYKNWQDIGGIAHTHSDYATAWAQSLRDIPIYGTTHADHLTNDIPCSMPMDDEMIKGNYELNTGYQIINCIDNKGLNYKDNEMILIGSHGPFTWGETPAKAVYNSAVLEKLAMTAFLTEKINLGNVRLKDSLIKKHFERKHGHNKYYGQY